MRLKDDGTVAGIAPLAGVRAHPVGFTWDPSTGVLWLAFAEADATTLEPVTTDIEPVARPRRDLTRTLDRLRLPTTFRPPPAEPMLMIRNAASLQTHYLTRALFRTPGAASTVRLTIPVVAGSLSDRFGDFVSGADGAWFVLTSNGTDDAIVRLRKIGSEVRRPVREGGTLQLFPRRDE